MAAPCPKFWPHIAAPELTSFKTKKAEGGLSSADVNYVSDVEAEIRSELLSDSVGFATFLAQQ